MKNIYKAIGLMSGTSLDGVDAALISTDGEDFVKCEGFVSIPYSDDLREKIRAVFGKKADQAQDIERELTLVHAEAVKMLISETGADDVDIIGFHGQTISHAPDEGWTCQIGDGALLSEMTGIKVVNDFRTADVKAGGQGAPLIPIYHKALSATLEKPTVFLNIGGVANITYIDKNGELTAFDTGPGNALLDDWMLKHGDQKYDDGGRTASTGVINGDIIFKFLSNKFFTKPAPKSLDRNEFASDLLEGLSLRDGAATLTAFTVRSIAKGFELLPEAPKKIIVAGGGRHNKVMMAGLKQYAEVISIDSLGLNGDATEAEGFAYLAVRSIKKLPISFPMTTGAPEPLTGGTLCE